MSLSVQNKFLQYSIWNLQQIKRLKRIIIRENHKTIIRKCYKKNNRKCSKIMKESLLFHCQNSQNAKENRCCFCYLKNGLSLSQYYSFHLFWCLWVLFERNQMSPFFQAMLPVTSTPWKAFFTKTYNGMTVSFHCYTFLAMWPGGQCIKPQIRRSWVQVPPDQVMPSLNPHPCSGLSKVAGFWRKSPPTWLVSAGYSAWHFFMDGVF